jgi:microcystin degradation protein MlrC
MPRPRVVAAEISHETNVFSAVPTDLDAFEAAGILRGNEIVEARTGTNSAFGGFIEGAKAAGLELIPIVAVWATPSGMVSRDAATALAKVVTDGITAAGHVDGVLLALHGAMVTESDEDGDAFFLEAVRRTVGPRVPIVATLDLHANFSPRMVASADLLIGYDTYPHVDMRERAAEASLLLRGLMERTIRPTTALRKPPMLPTSQRMTTDQDPMRGLIARAHEMEAMPGVVNVTVAGGFPPADVEDAGFGVLVTTDDDQRLADRLADELALRAWAVRDQFLGGVIGFDEAAAIIEQNRPRDDPLVVVDIGDNPWTGGPGDSAELLRFFLSLNLEHAALALIRDPESVQHCIAASVGATVDLILGGKIDRLHGAPLPVHAYVRLLSDGCYVNVGPMMAGVPVNLGASAVVICGPHAPDSGVAVLLTTRAETPIDLNVFRSHGIEPTGCRVIGLKGKGHFRAAFEPIANRVILVEGPGITGADLSRLPFRRIRRPIWPLDQLVTFST